MLQFVISILLNPISIHFQYPLFFFCPILSPLLPHSNRLRCFIVLRDRDFYSWILKFPPLRCLVFQCSNFCVWQKWEVFIAFVSVILASAAVITHDTFFCFLCAKLVLRQIPLKSVRIKFSHQMLSEWISGPRSTTQIRFCFFLSFLLSGKSTRKLMGERRRRLATGSIKTIKLIIVHSFSLTRRFDGIWGDMFLFLFRNNKFQLTLYETDQMKINLLR